MCLPGSSSHACVVAPTLLQHRHEGQNFQLGSSADETKEPIIGEAPHPGWVIDSSSPLLWNGSFSVVCLKKKTSCLCFPAGWLLVDVRRLNLRGLGSEQPNFAG